MLYKTMIGITAGVILSSASAAFAYEDPENRIGDRYPRLEQKYQPISVSRSTARQVAPKLAPASVQYSSQAPENKIGDRYPLLEARTVSQRAPSRTAGAGSISGRPIPIE